MIYKTKCLDCGIIRDIKLPIQEYDKLKAGHYNCVCGGEVRQIITLPKVVISRSPFPSGLNENSFPDPVNVKDSKHCKDLCDEHGLTSGYLENDM